MEVLRFKVWQRAGVPERYHGLTLQSLAGRASSTGRDLSMYKAAKRWREAVKEGDRPWLTLAGPAGCGKTALAACLIGEVYEQVPHSGFVTASQLVDTMRDPDRCGYMRAIIDHCDLLVIDDVGAEYATYFSNSVLDNLVAESYAVGRMLVMTTNYALGELDKVVSKRMLDRMTGDGEYVWYEERSWRGDTSEWKGAARG